ncbi:hypothetical protein JH06_0641 [Blastocystis sp. subtype 4]|uniref:hypothetical protein n=1 Tax=Blastocystis sp. subtype 4 TaxID=944170 RepID=UPI00071221B0|nr:hypothetical protein JH06_0641 [Blastocystis sp. subtype 4]KNB46303.1 hypothetical protein JH06_0641 [Blastocystis sp. subtype 4]|eukprot:XP_014529731.1 hypothetical protein JH06_0641 [Blastocystis sp. subtype 4]
MSDTANIQLGGNQYPLLGRGEYDAIIFGLGFRECLVASLLIKAKKKVLIISKKQSFNWDNTSFDLLSYLEDIEKKSRLKKILNPLVVTRTTTLTLSQK